MKTICIDLDETFWGDVLKYAMPTMGLFCVEGTERRGWLVTPETADKFLSEEAQRLGVMQDSLLRFAVPSAEADFIRYELLDWYAGCLTNLCAVHAMKEEMDACAVYGHLECPEYFGECPPPSQTPSGITECFRRIGNGIYCVKSRDMEYFCIYQPITEALSIAASHMTDEVEDYQLFDRETALIPVYELRDGYPEVRTLIADEGSLVCEIYARHMDYVRDYMLDPITRLFQRRPTSLLRALPCYGPSSADGASDPALRLTESSCPRWDYTGRRSIFHLPVICSFDCSERCTFMDTL